MTGPMKRVIFTAKIEKMLIDAVDIDQEETVPARPLDAMDDGPGSRPDRAIGVRMPARKIGKRRFRLTRGVTVDSGAADNVMPRRLLRGRAKVRPSEASRAGVHYVACNNGRIANEGEADLEFLSAEGNHHSWTFQIAEVNKVLASVSAMVDAGHRVIFDKDDKTGMDISFIVNKKTGVSTKMRREKNVWVVDAWIEEENPEHQGLGFARQG